MENNNLKNDHDDQEQLEKKKVTARKNQQPSGANRIEGGSNNPSSNRNNNTSKSVQGNVGDRDNKNPRRNNNNPNSAPTSSVNSNLVNTGQIKLLTRRDNNDGNVKSKQLSNGTPAPINTAQSKTDSGANEVNKHNQKIANDSRASTSAGGSGEGGGSMKSRKLLLSFQTNSDVTKDSSSTGDSSHQQSTVTVNSNSARLSAGGRDREKDNHSRHSNSSNSNKTNPNSDHHKQVQNMLATGTCVRKQGIVVTLKNEFGFIKPEDQPEEIYFRIKDVYNPTEFIKVSEGDEMSYFVMKEIIKGKLSDRAILLEPLPKGTVQLEVTVAVKVKGYVISTPRTTSSVNNNNSGGSSNTNNEEPGRVKLCTNTPLKHIDVSTTTSKKNDNEIKYVEVWQRCLTDSVQCRVGDELEMDVIYYKPENLYFVRNVKIKKYFSLFREYGRVKRIVKEGGFAFVRSIHRSNDLYFRLSEVSVCNEDDGTNSNSAAAVLDVGSLISFDVIYDDRNNNSGGNSNSNDTSKLKAVRIQLLSSTIQDQFQSTSQNVTDFHIFRKLCLHKIKEKVTGTVIRTSERTERTDVYKSFGHIEFNTSDAMTACHDMYPSDFRASIELFVSQLTEVSEIILPSVTQSRVTLFRKMFDDLYPRLMLDGVALAVDGNNTSNDPGAADVVSGEGHTLKLRRLSDQEYMAKQSQKNEGINNTVDSPAVSVLPSMSRTTFCLADIQDPLISACPSLPMTNLSFIFDLYYDFLENKTVARNIQVNIINNVTAVTPNSVPAVSNTDSSQRVMGVLECVRKLNTHTTFGLIRRVITHDVYIAVLPSSSSSSSAETSNSNEGKKDKHRHKEKSYAWESGKLVYFDRSLWGGRLVYAHNVVLLSAKEQSAATSASSITTFTNHLLIGLVVNSDKVVIIDQSNKMKSKDTDCNPSSPLDIVMRAYWSATGLRSPQSDGRLDSAMAALSMSKKGSHGKHNRSTTTAAAANEDSSHSFEKHLTSLLLAELQDAEQIAANVVMNSQSPPPQQSLSLDMLIPLCQTLTILRDPVTLVHTSSPSIATNVTTPVAAEFTPPPPSVGDLVYCTAVCDTSGVPLTPLLRVISPVKLPLPTIKKVKGLISRIDIPPEVLLHHSPKITLTASATRSHLADMHSWFHSDTTSQARLVTQFCEIRLVDSSVSVSSVAVALATVNQMSVDTVYYCDVREITPAVSTGNKPIQSTAAAAVVDHMMSPAVSSDVRHATPNRSSDVNSSNSIANAVYYPKVGDMVEFYPVDLSDTHTASGAVQGLAVGVTVLPPPSVQGNVSDGIHFRPRPSITSSLAAVTSSGAGGQVSSQPLGGSTMAEGPPDNNGDDIGFKTGWRVCPDVAFIKNLSWKHLLTHLLPTNDDNSNNSNGDTATVGEHDVNVQLSDGSSEYQQHNITVDTSA